MNYKMLLFFFITISFLSCKTTMPEPVSEVVMQLPAPEPEPVPEEPIIVLPQAPVFSFQAMRVEKINSTMVELYVSVNLENPNEFELPAPRLSFDYQVYETSIIRTRLNSPGPLPASSATPLIFGLVVYYDDLFHILPALIREKEAPSILKLFYNLEISVDDEGVSDFKIPFTLPIYW